MGTNDQRINQRLNALGRRAGVWPALFVLAALSACGSTAGTPTTTPLNSTAFSNPTTNLEPGWNRIETAGSTSCSDGSDYAFFVRPGDPDKLMVYLQGGGACWNLATCDPLGQPTYNVGLSPNVPQRYDGIFNFSREDNPLRNHTVVFAPYCSGDVHIGAAEQHFERSAAWLKKLGPTLAENGIDPATVASAFTVRHRGFANMQAVMDWTLGNLAAPASVLVTGSSAGSIPSPYYALKFAQAYPDATINQLGDAAGGYRRTAGTINPNSTWNTVPRLNAEPAFAGLTDADFDYEELYIRAKQAAPRIRMHAYDAAEDDVQLRFLKLGGVELPGLYNAITANQADIRQADPDFRSYIAAGQLHTILARPEFYRYRVGRRSVRDWVADIVAGASVEDVSCAPCTREQTGGGR